MRTQSKNSLKDLLISTLWHESDELQKRRSNKINTAFLFRESTNKQEFETQINISTRYADRAGLRYDRSKSFYVETVSGRSKYREVLHKLISDIKAGTWEHLVIYSSSRAARNLLVSAELEEAIRRYTIKIHITSIGRVLDLNRPEDRAFWNQSQYEDEKQSRQTERDVLGAMREKAREGKHMGKPPFGLKKDKDGYLIPDNEKRNLIRRIFRELECLSYRQLRDKLNEQRIPPPSGRRNGKKWTIGTLAKVVHTPQYLGHAYFGLTTTKDKQNKKGRVKQKNNDKIVKKYHIYEPTISLGQWIKTHKAIHDRMGNTSCVGIKNFSENNPALISNLWKCGWCNKPMKYLHRTRKKKNEKIKTYEWLDCGTKNCPGGYLNFSIAKQYLHTTITYLLKNKKELKKRADKYYQKFSKMNFKKSLLRIENKLLDWEEKKQKLLERFNCNENTPWIDQIMQNIQLEIDLLKAKKSRLRKILKLQRKNILEKVIYQKLKKCKKNLEKSTPLERLYFLRKTIKNFVYYCPQKIEIILRFDEYDPVSLEERKLQLTGDRDVVSISKGGDSR